MKRFLMIAVAASSVALTASAGNRKAEDKALACIRNIVEKGIGDNYGIDNAKELLAIYTKLSPEMALNQCKDYTDRDVAVLSEFELQTEEQVNPWSPLRSKQKQTLMHDKAKNEIEKRIQLAILELIEPRIMCKVAGIGAGVILTTSQEVGYCESSSGRRWLEARIGAGLEAGAHLTVSTGSVVRNGSDFKSWSGRTARHGIVYGREIGDADSAYYCLRLEETRKEDAMFSAILNRNIDRTVDCDPENLVKSYGPAFVLSNEERGTRSGKIMPLPQNFVAIKRLLVSPTEARTINK